MNLGQTAKHTAMKTKQIRTIAVVAAVACAAMFVSCKALEKATERDYNVNDLPFTVKTYGQEAPSRAGGTTHFAGDYTIKRQDLLGNLSFDYDMLKSVKIGSVSIDVVQNLSVVMIKNLTLSCAELTQNVQIANTPLDALDQNKQNDLKTFAAALITKIVRDGQARVSVDATFDGALSQESIDYLIKLSGIVVRVGFDL